MVRRKTTIAGCILACIAGVWVVGGATTLQAQPVAEQDLKSSAGRNIPAPAERAVTTTAASFLPPVLGPIVVPPFETKRLSISVPRGVSVPTAGSMDAASKSQPNTLTQRSSARERPDEDERSRESGRESGRDAPTSDRGREPLTGLNQNAP